MRRRTPEPGDTAFPPAAAASDVTFPAGHRIVGDGGSAARSRLIQSGHAALDVHLPGAGQARLQGTRTRPIARTMSGGA